MPIEYRKRITREMVRAEPDKLFVFGDNMIRKGLGGLAKQVRGEPNGVGIPTKRLPSMAPNAFFSDADWYDAVIPIDDAIERLSAHLHAGKTVVWPSDDIGTGLADLPTKAPKIWRYIQAMKAGLKTI